MIKRVIEAAIECICEMDISLEISFKPSITSLVISFHEADAEAGYGGTCW